MFSNTVSYLGLTPTFSNRGCLEISWEVRAEFGINLEVVWKIFTSTSIAISEHLRSSSTVLLNASASLTYTRGVSSLLRGGRGSTSFCISGGGLKLCISSSYGWGKLAVILTLTSSQQWQTLTDNDGIYGKNAMALKNGKFIYTISLKFSINQLINK